MAQYLTIPEITDYEELQSLSTGADGLTYTVVMAAGGTATRLMRAADQGEQLPLVVLVTDAGMLALDAVYVSGIQVSSSEGIAVAQITFLAGAVRMV